MPVHNGTGQLGTEGLEETPASLNVPGTATGSSEETGARTGSGCSQLDDQAAYDLLEKLYPVTVNGAAPKRSVRALLTWVHERYCYNCWRRDQLQLRMQHVLEHFDRRLPSENRVRSWIEEQGWTANVPDAALVLRQ
ncbi:hypothetical protein MHYP_G00028170 [Metynnis hypsauchen]